MICGSNGCNEVATHTVHWPGKSLYVCDEHIYAAKKVAQAMGFALKSTPLLPVRSETVQPETVALVRELYQELRDHYYKTGATETTELMESAEAWLEVHE